MASLYEISQEYLRVLESIDINEDGEIENIEALEALQVAGENLENKMENVALYVKSEEAFVKSMKEEKKTLESRISSKENKVERLRKYLADTMRSLGYNKFETARTRLSFRSSESLDVRDTHFIPDRFVTHVSDLKIDKTALKKAINDGLEVSGVEIVKKANLQIK